MVRERAARRFACAWALIALATAQRAAATATASSVSLSDLSAAGMAPSPSAPLDLVVNGAVHDPVQVVLRDGDALVALEDLEGAGLRAAGARRETIDGRAYVSLAALAPAVRFEVDEHALAIRLTAGPELLGRTPIDLRPTLRPADLEVRSDGSGFLNYSVQHRTDGRTSGFAEAGVSRGARLVYASGQLLEDGTVVRGLTSLTFDDVPAMRRLVLGDSFATSSSLGGGVLLAGVSLAREYGLDPYFVRAPMPQLSGFASTPSTLDVYVNGVLTRQVPLAPGGYDVTNLPVTAGAGNVRTELRDAFGRTEVLDWTYYYAPSLLSPGLSDYGYSLGFRRIGFGTESFDYGRPVLLGRHRVGITERLTLGGRLDAAEDLVSSGPSATIGLPFGTLELEAAASADRGALGGAGSVGYSVATRRFGGGVLVRLVSDRYAHAALAATSDRARVQTSVYAGAPLTSRFNVGASWSLLERRDAGSSGVVSVRGDMVLARNVTLGVTASRSTTPHASPTYDVFGTLSWAFAPLSIADTTAQLRHGGDATMNAGVQRGLPAGTGYGYRARGVSSYGAPDTAMGLVQYQWDHGRYEVQYDRLATGGLGTATVAGGVVALGDRVFLTRPVQEGFGLIRVGVPGVRGFAEGQEVGRTDRRGDLFVPRLLPYYGNRVGIADQDVPVEYHIGPTELVSAPTLRGGVIARFEVAPVRAVEGALVTTLASGLEVPPAYGELTLAAAVGSPRASPVGGDGRFFLEDVPAGTHAATVQWSSGLCTARLVVPETPALADLGQVRCFPVVLAKAKPPAAAKTPASAEGSVPPTPMAMQPRVLMPEMQLGRPASETETPTPTATATATNTDAAPAQPAETRVATLTSAPPPEPRTASVPTSRPTKPPPVTELPPPRGYGPRTPRCPSCAVCLSAALKRLATPTTQSRCVADLTIMQPSLGRKAAANVCLANPDLDELCRDCVQMRWLRRCPTWPKKKPE